MMVLKKAFGPALFSGIPILPTYIFGLTARDRFARAYNDAGLLQTSALDGWDTSKGSSKEERQKYREWLVDCHKASFVPICLAGETNFFTAEPAVVVPLANDLDEAAAAAATGAFTNGIVFDSSKPAVKAAAAAATEALKSRQFGATFRRVVFASMVAKRMTSSTTPLLSVAAPPGSDASASASSTPSDTHHCSLDREESLDDDEEALPLGRDSRYYLERECSF
jgi:hypothetical protein